MCMPVGRWAEQPGLGKMRGRSHCSGYATLAGSGWQWRADQGVPQVGLRSVSPSMLGQERDSVERLSNRDNVRDACRSRRQWVSLYGGRSPLGVRDAVELTEIGPAGETRAAGFGVVIPRETIMGESQSLVFAFALQAGRFPGLRCMVPRKSRGRQWPLFPPCLRLERDRLGAAAQDLLPVVVRRGRSRGRAV